MANNYHIIDGNNLTVENSVSILRNNLKLKLDPASAKKINASRKLVEDWIAKDEVIYGITTGFGEFKNVKISAKDLNTLQHNLIKSHSAGVGNLIPDDVVRLMILFRINSLAKGFSGVRLELVESLINFFNSGIIPLIPSQGSVGSSGDLSPLSQLALALIGEGNCKLNGKIYSSSAALKKCGLKPVQLSAKEGLALINGTQMMTAYLCSSLFDAINICKLADISGAMSLDAMRGIENAFDKKIHEARPHKGQIKCAENLRALLKDSEIMKSHDHSEKVQDAYSLRCMPQVHGAVRDTITYCKGVLETEINSATDNPLIFPETGEYISGGNFHGEPVALIADFLAIAISELGSISERRTARLVDGSLSGLPRFLIKEGGLNSGLMIAQYTSAALASENKILSHPASVDSIPTSANQEDHNSMGSIGARKFFNVTENVKNIIAIEFLCAAQGLDFLLPLKSGRGVSAAHQFIRKGSKHISEDGILNLEIETMKRIITDEKFLSEVEKITGNL
jgi:histidine ammonia-lyase